MFKTVFKKQRIPCSIRYFITTSIILFSSTLFLKSENLPFGEYEKIEYKIKWLFITCGKASLEIKKTTSNIYQITSLARSLPFFDSFYKVRDKVVSLWDVKRMRSLMYEKNIREGRHKNYELITIDVEKNIAIFGKDKWKITENSLDVLSALYYVRTFDLNKKSDIKFDVYTKRKLWKLKVVYHGKRKIKIDGKTYNTILVEPKLRDEGIFKAKGRILVYFTDDEKKIPILMKSKIPVGSIVAVMEKIQVNSSESH